MRINSSYVGMESERLYQASSTRKLSFRVQTGSVTQDSQLGAGMEHALGTDRSLDNAQGREDALKGSQNENMKNTAEDEVQAAQEEMSNRGYIRSIRQVNLAEERSSLESIRQQCILYLWNLFFGQHKARDLADKYGLNQNYGSNQNYSMNQGVTGGSSWLESGGLGQNLTTLQPVSFTLVAEQESIYMESESTSFSTTGTVKTADGREINFNLDVSMSRNFVQYNKERVENAAQFIDPLVINLNGNIAEVSDQKFYFDLDADGEEEAISRLCEDSGYLALDKNEDGQINDGSELFGTTSGDGFADLAQYDEDGNGWIDEADAIWDKLKIWVQDENGNSKLYRLAEQGVGAICLQNADTQFEQRGISGEVNAAIRKTGIFLYENGGVGTMQHLDLTTGGEGLSA